MQGHTVNEETRSDIDFLAAYVSPESIQGAPSRFITETKSDMFR